MFYIVYTKVEIGIRYRCYACIVSAAIFVVKSGGGKEKSHPNPPRERGLLELIWYLKQLFVRPYMQCYFVPLNICL